MKLFDVTLCGYYGGLDNTDHLVKWVRADSLESLTDRLSNLGLTDHIQSITDTPAIRNISFDDGMDVDENDKCKNGELLNPADWIEQSQKALKIEISAATD